MDCLGCSQEGREMDMGVWCDRCGGVMLPGPEGPRLFFRHVATADGAGGRFPIVWDISMNDYMVLTQECNKRGGRDLDGLRPPHLIAHHGSLDSVIAFIQPHAKGEGDEFPTLVAAPTATDNEKAVLDPR